MVNYIYDYYQKIEDGTIAVGSYVKMAYQMIIKGLEDKLFFYNPEKADQAIKFIEGFAYHVKGKPAPDLIKLELWQKALISCIFGIEDKDGFRQFREVKLPQEMKTSKLEQLLNG